MHLSEIKKYLLSIDQLKGYDEYINYVDGIPPSDQYLSYDYIFIAAKSTGGHEKIVMEAAASHLAVFLSIHLTDDILDNEPGGLHTKYGAGSVSNMAQALLACGYYLLKTYENKSYYPLLVENLSDCILKTCLAQHKEFSAELNEKAYWELIGSKTPPLFSSALYTGALIATGEPNIARDISGLGSLFGKIIQVSDDLADAFKHEVVPDWYSKMNLAILYALLADHHNKDEFTAKIRTVNMEGHLERLQAILLQCGAVSYCVYHLIEMNKKVVDMIDHMPLVNKKLLHDLRKSIIKPSLEVLLEVSKDQNRREIEELIRYC